MNSNDRYVNYLRSIDVDGFADRVEAFWVAPRGDDTEVFERFLDVVSVDSPEGKSAHIASQQLRYPAGQTMWRVRRVRHAGDGTSIPGMNSESDVWEAPAQFVTSRGRLNDVGESVLYCSIGDATIAMKEARVPAGERFALIRYETKQPVKLTAIASADPPEGIPEDLSRTHAAVVAFYRDVFTRQFDGDDWTYVLSNRVAKDWYDLPQEVTDGWSFPSIVYGTGVNAAFRPARARQVLQVSGVAYCEAVDSALLGQRMKAYAFSPGPEGAGDFSWFTMGSAFQKSQFPEFR